MFSKTFKQRALFLLPILVLFVLPFDLCNYVKMPQTDAAK